MVSLCPMHSAWCDLHDPLHAFMPLSNLLRKPREKQGKSTSRTETSTEAAYEPAGYDRSDDSSPGQPELAVLAVLAESSGIGRGRFFRSLFFRWNLSLSSDPSRANESTTKASGSAFLSVRPSG